MMAHQVALFVSWLLMCTGSSLTRAEEVDCDVESRDCTCVMPKLYDCPTVNLTLKPVPQGCGLLQDKLAESDFSNLTCGINETYNSLPNDWVSFAMDQEDNKWLEFENAANANGCNDDFYFIVDLNGGQLVRTVTLEDINPSATGGHNVSFEFAYGYTVPCTDQPTINTLLWQYITPGWYPADADLAQIWNRLNFTDDVFQHNEETYFKAAYLFIHFNKVPQGSRFRLKMTGCREQAKDINPALEYLNNLLGVTNDTKELAAGIAVSSTALSEDYNLTSDEAVLLLDSFEALGNETIDYSGNPEEAQNITEGLAAVASIVLGSISSVSLPETSNEYLMTTPAGPYTEASNTPPPGDGQGNVNPDKKEADQQAQAILTIERAIGVVTAGAGNVTITVTTPNLVIVSAPLEVSNNTQTQTIDLSTEDPADGSGEGGESNTVQVEVDLSNVASLLARTPPPNVPTNRTYVPVRFTALKIKADDLLDTRQNTQLNSSVSAGDSEEQLSSHFVLNSDIFSFSVYVHGIPLPVPVNVQYTNKEGVQSYSNSTLRRQQVSTCVWLTEEKAWSDRGCQTTNETTDETTYCSCDHTTSFAVLVQVVDFQISQGDSIALNVLSYIGIGLSILCLAIALFIFFTVGALRTSERNMIHRNLMIALLLAYIVFLGGVDYAKDIKIVCTIVAALLHYLYLCVFGWMLIEGIHLYLMLVKVFGSEGSKLMYYRVVGWGVPVIIVGVSVAIKHTDYGNEDRCWMAPNSDVIWAFVGPVIAVILFNFFVLCMVLRIIYRSSAISVDCPVDQVKAAAKGSIALLPILGVTWCLGIFAFGQSTLVFQYLFVICNSTQGILLFVFHCLFNSEVRNALKREQEKMGWSTAGTQHTKKARVHPEDSAHSTAKGLTTSNLNKAMTKSTSADEGKSVVPYKSNKGPKRAKKMKNPKGGHADDTNSKTPPKKTNSEFSLPGQIEDPLDEAQTSTIRQEIKTEREMEQSGWKIKERKHVQRTFVRVEEAQ